jgi:hypothetical protein
MIWSRRDVGSNRRAADLGGVPPTDRPDQPEHDFVFVCNIVQEAVYFDFEGEHPEAVHVKLNAEHWELGGTDMFKLMKSVGGGVAVLGFVSLQPTSGEDKSSHKVRGRVQEYERATRLLVVYPRNRVQPARDAVRQAGFKVVEHDLKLDAFRCRWGGNDRKKRVRPVKCI